MAGFILQIIGLIQDIEKHWNRQHTVEVIGTTVSVLSIILGGYFAADQEKKLGSVEQELSQANNRIQSSIAEYQRGESKNQFVQLLLTIVESSSLPHRVVENKMAEVRTNALGAVMSRYVAAAGIAPPEEERLRWMAMDLDELSKIS
jgi:hypothetical protein